MPAVKNNGSLFQDGDLIIQPGETVEVDESRATVLLRDYADQFSAASGGKSTRTEDEIKEAVQDYQVPVVETRADEHKTVETEDGEAKSKKTK